jgi:hypothetical protein
MNETHEKTNHVFRPLAVSSEKLISKISGRYSTTAATMWCKPVFIPAKRIIVKIYIYSTTPSADHECSCLVVPHYFAFN